MNFRRTVSLTTAAAAVALVGLLPNLPAAHAQDTSSWCVGSGGSASPPCVLSATRDGNPVLATDSTYDVTLSFVAAGSDGSNDVQVSVQPAAGGLDLGSGEAGHVWSVKVDLGTVVGGAFIPRVAALDAAAGSIDRVKQGDGTYRVTLTGKPVHETFNGDCNTSASPWTCPATASADEWTFHSEVTDYKSWTDVDQRNSMYGLNYFTNVGNLDWPPQVQNDSTTGSQQIVVDMANQHYYSDGTTVFHGFLEMDIPYAFLKNVYGVDDPASMVGSGVSSDLTKWSGGSASPGTTSAVADDPNNSLDVKATDLTFSAKVLHIHRGIVTPTRPTRVHAARTSTHGARVTFAKSKPRGYRVRGYFVSCVSSNGKHHATSSGLVSPVHVSGLTAGVAYACRVYAKSRAGHSRWSDKAHLPA